jgi:aminobenzoyl-glutamate utilization protein B
MFRAFTILFAGLALSAPTSGKAGEPVATADAWIEANRAHIVRIADALWDYSEPGFQEHCSSKLLADTLEQAGFIVRRGVAGMKTAFVAEYGRGSPVVGFLAEFDALPGMSQKVAAEKAAREAGNPGHACGHNLLGTASVAAALAVKESLARNGLSGKIVVFGTPAEEGGSGKSYMVRDGMFRGVDAVIAWHPDVINRVQVGSSLAVKRAKFRFFGREAHAALEPEKGRSALDGVELMNVGANYLREHVPSDVRIHYIISHGGDRPNVVPAEAEAWYYVRGPRMADAAEVFARLTDVARGARLMTQTRMEVRGESGAFEVLSNRALAAVVDRNLRRVGGPPFDEADIRFARRLRKNLGLPTDGPPLDTEVSPVTSERRMTSTDVGDVSWVVPAVEFRVATGAVGTATHTWPFAATAGGPIGHKGCLTAARVMAGTALDLFVKPACLEPIRAEFAGKTRNFTYRCPIPADSKPPERIDP